MLISLHVKNLALIEEEEIFFEDGLNILTGETGAGKSIVIGSVGLALGAKADRNLIRTGAEFALIEMIFQIDHEKQRQKLREMEIEPDEDGCILVKRRIYPGRSTCSAGGETVTTRQLREIAELMIDVYGQRENQKLLRREAQLDVIDEYAGEDLAKKKAKVQELYHRSKSLKEEYERDDLDDAARTREMDLIAYEIREIEEASLKEGEDEELESALKRMTNFQRISQAVQTADAMIEGPNAENAGSFVERALRELLHMQGLDPELDKITDQFSDIDSLLADAARSLGDYASGMSFDPQEMEAVELRLSLVHRLKDKYGRTFQAVMESLKARQERLAQLEDYDAVREKLRADIRATYEALTAACGEISVLRRQAADAFEKALTGALLDLNFYQVEFEVRMESGESHLGADGWDRVIFYISMNPGEALRPLDEIASGGELSRIMLGLKTVFAGKDEIHTFIFDEIDSGISGQTAWKVSEKLAALSAGHQIICITHLPQIAAMEDAHFEIVKTTQDGRTRTHIRRLTEEGSNEELARLLGAGTLTESALGNAQEMKRMAQKAKKS